MKVSRLDSAAPNPSASLAALFDAYRQHYGQPAELAECTSWLRRELRDGSLICFQGQLAAEVAGFALVTSLPASQRLAHFWQLRDLFVAGAHRRAGLGTALVCAVRDAAAASGAVRLALQTEADNSAALALYERLGFERVDGYIGLLLPL